MPVWILITFFILFPLVCALCFGFGAHFNYKIFMSDTKFEDYIKYHRAFEKMFKQSQSVRIIEDISFEGQEGENVKNKEKNGGF